jgi:hypothetical protein
MAIFVLSECMCIATCLSVSVHLATRTSHIRPQAVVLSLLLVFTCCSESIPLAALLALLLPCKRIKYADTGTDVPVTLCRDLPRLQAADGTAHFRAAKGIFEAIGPVKVDCWGGYVEWRSLNCAAPERVLYHTMPMFVHECTQGELETTGPYIG